MKAHITPTLPYPQDMQDALKKFGYEADRVITAFVKTLESQKLPPIIYHYTDDVGRVRRNYPLPKP